MKTIIIIVALMLSISCVKKQVEDKNNALSLTNIAYGSDTKQKLDIYLPAERNAANTKLLVLIHGGGWNEGDKADFNLFITELQRRLPDYAIANINYRLFNNNQNKFPTQENDVKAAIDFLINKSVEYKISKKLALLGASAGAHLSLLQAYKYSDPVPIKAVISFFGPTELISLYNNPPGPTIPLLLSLVTGGTPLTIPSLYEQSSPYNFVTNTSCPTLVLQGGNDPLIPASQSVLLINQLTAKGVFNQYVYYPNEGHGWTGPNLDDSFNKIETFLKQQL